MCYLLIMSFCLNYDFFLLRNMNCEWISLFMKMFTLIFLMKCELFIPVYL